MVAIILIAIGTGRETQIGDDLKEPSALSVVLMYATNRRCIQIREQVRRFCEYT